MKILYIIESAGGGSGLNTTDLAETLALCGHDVTLLYSTRRLEDSFRHAIPALEKAGVKLATIDMAREVGKSDLKSALAIRQFIRQHGPFDIVHGQSSKGGAMARLTRFGFKHKVVYTPHMFRTMGPDLSPRSYKVFSTIERILSRWTDRLICVSQAEVEHAVSLGISPAKIVKVYNGIRTRPKGDRAALRAKLGIPDGTVVFGTIGRMMPQKDPLNLIRAFKTVPDEINAQLIHIGGGELEAQVREEAKGIAKIHVLGEVSGWEWLAAMDVFVLASRSEGFAYTLIEACAYGLPCIVSSVGGNVEIITEGVNGKMVPPGDPEALAKVIQQLAQDSASRNSLGAKALEYASRFTVEEMAKQTEKVYETVRA